MPGLVASAAGDGFVSRNYLRFGCGSPRSGYRSPRSGYRSPRFGMAPGRALGADGFMSSVGCSGDVRSGCCLYAVSSLTYAIRPECSAGLVAIKALGSPRCWVFG